MKKNNNNNNLFEEIYNTYYDNIYKYVYMCVKDKKNTEDIISSIFNNAFNNLNKCSDLIEAKYLLFSKACIEINEFNKNKVICFSSALSQKKLNNSAPNLSSIGLLLEKLPKDLKQLMFLKYYGDLNSYEISKVLNISHNIVDYRILKATEKLKQIYSLETKTSSNVIQQQSV